MKSKNQAKSAQFFNSINGTFKGGLSFRDSSAAHKLFQQKTQKKTKPQKETSFLREVLKNFLNLLIVVSFSGLLFWQGPKVFYSVFPKENKEIAQDNTELKGNFDLNLNLLDEAATKRKVLPSQRSYKPAFNPNLPDGDWLVIPRIGVRSELQQTENYEEALNVGLWWVPDFGKAGDRSKPMIVAGHRYGFDWWWKDDYWKYHSFYSLPDLESGDRVEVISDHRKWIYEIYSGEEGEEISDYQADLILYTCKHLDSPIRIFRYAKIVEVKENSALGILSNKE